jgi:hypothetical protein
MGIVACRYTSCGVSSVALCTYIRHQERLRWPGLGPQAGWRSFVARSASRAGFVDR